MTSAVGHCVRLTCYVGCTTLLQLLLLSVSSMPLLDLHLYVFLLCRNFDCNPNWQFAWLKCS